MTPALRVVETDSYGFDVPAVVVGGRLCCLDAGAWHSGEAWQTTLEQLTAPAAFVLPLELSVPGRTRQDLLGYELLVHLRFSAPASVSGLPVLLAAWQPLQDVLSRRSDLLIVGPAVDFHRLPDAAQRLAGFVADASSGKLAFASTAQIAQASEGPDQEAARVSYHDLANDYYAAHRLWVGYRALLKSAAESGIADAKRRLEQVAGLKFPWEPALEVKLRSPLVRRFQAQRANQRAPRYPIIENSHDMVAVHVREGLPSGMRILLVDDEFDRGAADVLLPVLFGQSQFTKRLDHEWVYSEPGDEADERWARFVCVRDVERARNWLAYWEGIDREQPSSDGSWQAWLKAWDAELSPRTGHRRGTREPEDVFAANREFVLDRHSAGPKLKFTVIMLDLRLQPVVDDLYSVHDFASYQFRRSVKAQRGDVPVIMFTASRQILNLAEILDSSADIDGWFMKEGPDIPVDDGDTNSANSVAYLLERLHLYSTLRGWYRHSFGWDTARKIAFASMFHSSRRDATLQEVSRLSSELFARILEGSASDQQVYGRTFLAFVQAHVPATPFPVAQTLVARRLTLAALLWTSDIKSTGLTWNAEAFASLLPGDTGKKVIKGVYDKLNFNQVLWMRSQGVLSQMLVDEIEWLLRIDWPAEKKSEIVKSLRRERESLG